ncbi:MAG: 5'-nucleotidase C-terminal domain-containing protein, partial [Cetobacterium sp.]
QLITDAILWKTKCDAVLINGGSIRDSIEAGDIKVGDIKNSIPFGNYIVIKKIQGSDLKLALENGLKGFPQNLGAMAQVAGLKVFFDSNKPPLNRIQNIVINDTPLNLNNYYHIATTDFMALGGEEYTSFIHGEEVFSYPAVEDIVIEYIKKFGVNSTLSIVPRLITN